MERKIIGCVDAIVQLVNVVGSQTFMVSRTLILYANTGLATHDCYLYNKTHCLSLLDNICLIDSSSSLALAVAPDELTVDLCVVSGWSCQ